MQELKSVRFPLTSTSKSAWVEKRWQGLCEKQTKLLTDTANSLWKHLKKEGEKVAVNFLGLVPLPHFHWSNLFWPAPFWVALLKQHLQGGPPAGSLYRNLGEAKKEEEKKKNQWSVLLMSLQDAVSRRPKEFSKIPADSPRASNASQKGEMMDISERP